MVTKPQNKNSRPADPYRLNNADFRWFILHFPAVVLKKEKIKRSSFVAVGMALAQFGNYEYGTNVNPSQKLIHTLTGAHEETIKKVYDLLKGCGALEVTGKHQGVNGGQPSEIFRFRRSRAVAEVLERRAAMEWKERANPVPESASSVPESASSVAEDNRNVRKELNGSVAVAPSPSSVALPLRGRDEEEKNDEDRINEMIADAFLPSDDELARLAQGL